MILFTGFQAAGTRGADLVAGNKSIKMHGEYVEIKCEVAQMENASAHADAPAMIDWLRKLSAKPKRVFVTHGEPEAADALRRRIVDELGFDAMVPEFGQKIDLE